MSKLNNVFSDYKNKYKNQKCTIFGTGNSIKKYKPDKYITDINIGVNEIIHYPIEIDFYFLGDPGQKHRGYRKEPSLYRNYKPNIAKFFRKAENISSQKLKLSTLPQDIPNTIYYTTDGIGVPIKNNIEKDFSVDITQHMTDGGSIIFEAIQFALFCGFAEIYLVGCDGGRTTFTSNNKEDEPHSRLLYGWKKMKKFIDTNYPETKIISINPVYISIFNQIFYEE